MHSTNSESSKSFDFLVFGATGMQGSIVIKDLLEQQFKVVVSSRKLSSLEKIKEQYPTLQLQPADLNDLESLIKVVRLLKPSVIINCAEGDWNINVYKAALASNAHVIDLGSDVPATKVQLDLGEEFKTKNLTAITGCGSTPGVNNVLLNYAVTQLDTVETIEAGFAWNSNMQSFVVPFSMESIVEEFTQPAPYIENLIWLEKLPLDTVQDRQFREIGEQKVFFVRHPEQYTFFNYYRDRGLKNVRFYAGFPTHSYNKILGYIKNSNFEKTHTISVEGKGEVLLPDLTKVLRELYPAPSGYEEKENLWVTVEGKKDGNNKKILMECIVPTLPNWKDAGCNIDTGLPASIIAQMLLNGVITQRGSFAPEAVVPAVPFFNRLREKGMTVWENGDEIKAIEDNSVPELRSVNTNHSNLGKMVAAVMAASLLVSFYLGTRF